MQSRRDNNLAARFPEIVAAARRLGDLVLDGELVVEAEASVATFTNRLRPRVHHLRPDLTVDDLDAP